MAGTARDANNAGGAAGCRPIPPAGILGTWLQSRAADGYVSDKESIMRRLARIEGQIGGAARMVEYEAYCVDVLTQIAAVTKALEGVG